MRLIKILAPALVAVSAVSGCVDSPVASRGGGTIRLDLAPRFSYPASQNSLPIERIRTTPRFLADGSAAGPPHSDDGIDPDDPFWTVEALVDLNGRDTATIVVEVELISLSSGSAVVEWSALLGPIFVDAANNEGEEFDESVNLIRGPLHNAGVTSLTAAGPAAVNVGASSQAWATVTAEGAYSVRWSSSNAAVASVEPAGDTVLVRGRAAGSAWIRAGAGFHEDSFLVRVDAVVGQPTRLVWQGGTAGAETDWFTASNWSPARVPTAADTVYFPSGSQLANLDADAEVAGIIGDSIGSYSLYLLENVTLTVHGDVHIPYVYGDSTTRLVMTGSPATLWGWLLPPLVIRGQVTVMNEAYAQGDVVIENGARLDVGVDSYLDMTGDLSVFGAGLVLSQDSSRGLYSYVSVQGDALFDGGDSRTTLTGGYMTVGGDFTVTATSCSAFRPTNLELDIISDTSTISIGCAGADGNRFWDLWIYTYSGADRQLTLASDLYVENEFYLDWAGTTGANVVGNGFTVTMRRGSIYRSTLDHAFVVVNGGTDDWFYADSLAFTGMTGVTRPQLLINDAGDGCFTCYEWQHVVFDRTASGPYIELNDLAIDGDSAIYYMATNPGDGPQRTVTSGEAAVYWADVPMRVVYWSGSGQTAPALTPLPDSLVAQVVDYAYYDVEGVTVNWRVALGDGTLSSVTSVSDSAGLATTRYTMGSANFPEQRIVASIPNGRDSTFFYAYIGTATGVAADDPASASLIPAPSISASRAAAPEREVRVAPRAPSRLRRQLDRRERR